MQDRYDTKEAKRAAFNRNVERYGGPKAHEMDATARRVQSAVKTTPRRRAPVASAVALHEIERMADRVRGDMIDDLEIERLRRAGVPEGHWRIQLIRRRSEARRKGEAL